MKNILLILSGPTHEYIDPVRFIGNASSGLMGRAIAEEAVRRKWFVEFITGPVAPGNLPDLGNAGSIHRVVSAEEMLEAAARCFDRADAVVFAAAVADYAPAVQRKEKMAKSGEELILRLRPTPDIARTLCARKQPGQTTIGFALQTAEGERHARKKLLDKNLDGIVLNTPSTLGAATGTFSYLTAGGSDFESWGCIDKQVCAARILNAIEQERTTHEN